MEESVAVSSLASSQDINVSIKNEPENSSLSIEDTSTSTEPTKEQQNNKGIKRKASSETQLYTCEVCHVKLNSASQAYQHFQGKSHKGKVKMLEMAAEVKAPPVVTAPVTDSSSSQQSIAPSSIEYYCTLCKKIFNSKMQADQHFSGKAHRHKVSEDAIAKASPYSSSGYKLGSCVAPNSQSTGFKIEKPQAKQPDVKLGSNVKCQLFSCDHCHITLNSPRQFEQHVNGLRHKIIVGKAKPPPPPQAEEPGWQEIRYKKLATAMTTVSLMKNLKSTTNINPGGTQLGLYYCKDCDISVNSPVQLQQHMTSTKHKTRIDGIAKGTVPPTRKKPKGRGGVTPSARTGRVSGRGRSLPSISSSFVKAGEISTFYTTQTIEASPVQPTFNATKTALPINGAMASQYSNYTNYTQQPYQMQIPQYSTQMF